MGKEFNKKYMHPTRRKLVDMIQTGEYEKNTTIGYEKKKEERNVGDTWEDDTHKYEKKDGYLLKTGKNSETFQEIRKYLEEKNKCKSSECEIIKKSQKDIKLIQKTGFCINCLAKRETELKLVGLWEDYQNYRVWTNMIIFGKTKLDSYRQSLSDLKEEYEMINDQGQVTETWKLPKPVDEVRDEINELIEYGEKELQELEEKRTEAFNRIKEMNYEHLV